MSFYKRVHQIVSCIPAGTVLSYGQVARLLGNPNMARQVGWALRACEESVPWYRVVNRMGSVMPGASGKLQIRLLRSEGVAVSDEGFVDKSFFFLPHSAQTKGESQ